MSTQAQIDALAEGLGEVASNANVLWLLVITFLMVSMQAGFALREVGTVQRKNTTDILYKYLFNGAVTAIAWWILAFGFANGNTKGGFIGVSQYGLDSNDFKFGKGNGGPFFQLYFWDWAFALTAVTVAGGALGERVKIQTALIASIAIAIWIYPIIAHWCWGQGWLSPFANQQYDFLFYGKDSNNYIDCAGSGVVHTVGGVCALVGAIALGARKGRFDSNTTLKKNSMPLVAVGTLVLWVGFYGYNVGSYGNIIGDGAGISGKIAALTTLCAAFSACTILAIQMITNDFDITVLANGLVAGLVAVGAGVEVIEMWGAMIIGIVAALVYVGASKALVHFKIDDVVDAFPVHAAAGIWGTLAVGIFGNDHNASIAGYVGSSNPSAHSHPFRTGEQFGVQLVGIICIVAWTAFWAALVFFGLKFTVGIRVPDEKEEKGDAEVSEV